LLPVAISRSPSLFLQYRGLPPSPIAAPPSGRLPVRASPEPAPAAFATAPQQLRGPFAGRQVAPGPVPRMGSLGSATQQQPLPPPIMRFAHTLPRITASCSSSTSPHGDGKMIDLRSFRSGVRQGRPPMCDRGHFRELNAWPPAQSKQGNPREHIL